MTAAFGADSADARSASVPPARKAERELVETAAVERWRRSYATRLFITDLIVVFGVVYGAQWIRFGGRAAELRISRDRTDEFMIGYSLVSLVLAVAWVVSLEIFATRDHKIIGTGSIEYRRIADATLRVFGLLAIVAFLLQSEVGRAYLLIALPMGLVLLLVSRWAWRQWLIRERTKGRFLQRAIVLGERSKARHIAEQMARDSGSGIVLVGAITDHGDLGDLVPGVPVIGSIHRVFSVMQEAGADTLVFAGTDAITPRELRELGWELEKRRVDLIVAPALTDVAGPRIHARPVAGLPLIHVDYPVFEGRKYVAKRAFDIIASTVLLVLLSPVLLVITLMVRRDSPGPAVFRQERVGLNGRRFQMLKFRSMVVGAEEQLPTLLDQSEGNGVLFKLRSDPRITHIGAALRRYSLDELPQLVNVLGGSMSLVGPRPPLPRELDRYDSHVHRRFLVKPGITGLWQISGRSNLSWEDSVRLDLYYVENWSLTGDIVILWRTAKAVIARDGAY